DNRFAYYDTEEVWFPEWEHHGTPYDKAEEYSKHNPVEYVKNWKTPTLVIHGGLDFRIPDTHGLAAVPAPQPRNVPDRRLQFPDRQQHGAPYDKAEEYSKHNPVEYVKNWKTPTLVIHGGLDFRIPDTHGMAAFTALQRRNVPSRFLQFPDENHWVLKPQNSKL